MNVDVFAVEGAFEGLYELEVRIGVGLIIFIGNVRRKGSSKNGENKHVKNGVGFIEMMHFEIPSDVDFFEMISLFIFNKGLKMLCLNICERRELFFAGYF